MKKTTREELKKKIITNFIKFIESKPEIMQDEFISEAFKKLKASLKKRNAT